jgi:hypothetical protein
MDERHLGIRESPPYLERDATSWIFLLNSGLSKIISLIAIGAKIRLKNRQIPAVTAAATWTISSEVLILRQAATEARTRATMKVRSIITTS